MRAGAFSELRVINLLNRRFIPFFFNTGGPGLGRDAGAEAFVKGKVKNKWAHFAVFDTKGSWLGESEIYSDKDLTFEFLVKHLKDNPEYNQPTEAEKQAFAEAERNLSDAQVQLRAGRVHEELGEYAKAQANYSRVLALSDGRAQVEAWRGRLRMARYDKDWTGMEKLIAEIPATLQPDLAADVAVERGYALTAKKRHAEARKLLERAIREHPTSTRMGEMRFYAGVAAWFLNDYDAASFQWCWIVENIPEDHMVRRAFTAAAHRGMPYPNPELGGYASDHPGGSIEVINAAYARAREVYLKLKAQGQK